MPIDFGTASSTLKMLQNCGGGFEIFVTLAAADAFERHQSRCRRDLLWRRLSASAVGLVAKVLLQGIFAAEVSFTVTAAELCGMIR